MPGSRPPEFDSARLEAFLRASVEGADGAYFHLERISGGQSNPTYFVTVGNRRLVMRKKPGRRDAAVRRTPSTANIAC